jgi:RNA polymerase sigma factor (sigma-70 family)
MDLTTPTPAADDPRRDLELVREVIKQRPEALVAFVERLRCVPRMLAALDRKSRSRLGPEELADLTQDTLTSIWRRLDTFEGRAALETWAFAFCVFEFKNRLRSRDRVQSHAAQLGGDAELDEVSAPVELRPIDYDHVYHSLERLGSPEADVVRLKHFDALTFDEIGARLRFSASTAKTYYYRGILRLRELLREETERRTP